MVAIASIQQRSDAGLGASEVAASIGLHPYQTPYDVYAVKTGDMQPFAGNDATRWGQLIEPAARTAYVEKTGYSLHVPPESLFHEEIEWARATPDAIVVDQEYDENHGHWRHLVQIKNTGFWPGQQWKHGPPDHVTIQEQWEMFVTGLPRADVVVSLGGGFPEIFTIHRDEKLIDDLVKAATKFWRHVENRIPPPIDDTASCRDYWTKRASSTMAEGVVVPWALSESIAEEYRAAWGDEKRAKKRLETAKNAIRSLCGQAQADGIEATDGNIMWSRRSTAATTDWQGVARLVASAKGMPKDEFDTLVSSHTTRGRETRAITVPRSWGKESAE